MENQSKSSYAYKTTEKDGEKAWVLHNEIVQNEQKRRGLLYNSMKAINELYSTKLYKTILGDDQAIWSSYLGQHGTYYSANQIYVMNKIYNKFIIELQLEAKDIVDISITKLSSLISIINKENVHDWLVKAQELTSQDFNDEIRVLQGHESYLDCKHDSEINYKICQKCGFRHKI